MNITSRLVIAGAFFSTLLFASQALAGGVTNVYVDGYKMEKAHHALYFKSNLDRGGMIEHVYIRATVGISVIGHPDAPVRDVTVRNTSKDEAEDEAIDYAYYGPIGRRRM